MLTESVQGISTADYVLAIEIFICVLYQILAPHETATTIPYFPFPQNRVVAPSLPKSEGGFLDGDVLDLFYDTWFSVYDDIRWFFLRESACVSFVLTTIISSDLSCRTLLANHPPASSPNLSVNLLSILERLATFPTEQSELNA